ncbi:MULTISPECIES: aminomethyl-transferring glycine dehydrogenase [Limnospira]|uniref:aminomethyl-transferring glycine dehydrogenase n=1 Tax=Limnospira TaxID=2596745 RepID=UPI0012C57BAE|nr:aminomethyl-transferring glycine dehydrogenase [Arthrospira sp. PLM2.Bin9]MDT9182294.1 aminomethyl-transferring glycine dehydrogenase [Limnospira sp. PMC 289.06]MDT9294427.1 aminomethyl-transferring glycine dehydrogenase [Arthrospira platensis PCC 7345]TVU53195.1 MAG: glycine dehydrogenase (aminomethyl-transferring) [Arthrospira sp. PLM2.Bin9]
MLDINLPGPTKSPNHSTSNLSHPRDGHINRTPADQFLNRHIGPNDAEIQQMLSAIGYNSIESLIDNTIPQGIRLNRPLNLPAPLTEHQALVKLREIASKNQVYRSFIGMGYSDCITPPIIQRNILENPGWYTAYTPYQAEIAQGRLEALLNFQTLVIDLTGLEIANASLLDEGTAAAEAMTMSYGISKAKAHHFFVSQDCHPQTIDVLETRAKPLGIEIIIGDFRTFDFSEPIFGALLQYPATNGAIYDYREFIQTAHNHKAIITMAADILSLTLLTPPGELGADIAVGSTQRLGVPLGYGGPHAAYFATRSAFKRSCPGRMVGVSIDSQGQPALRLALQTREQHIRRDKATSNICTAQVLLAVIASMYGVYHGPQGLKQIAENIHQLTLVLATGLQKLGYAIANHHFFDTLQVELGDISSSEIITLAQLRQINLRQIADNSIGISLDETTTTADIINLLEIFAMGKPLHFGLEELAIKSAIPPHLTRTSAYLTHPVFNSHHSETELLRYLHRLESRDLSLTTSMIPLGSCTMKLNATAEMIPVTWPEFGKLHPFAPKSQTQGYQILCQQLEEWLAEITGFAGISLQPNAGSQGEYAGLLAIRGYHQSRGENQRHICLIPESAHGTNPASAVMCGMKVVPVKCDSQGNIDIDDLQQKAEQHQDQLAALMVTYPSTHGVFEDGIRHICDIIHRCGGQVYMDGANMNAQVGLCRPGDFGADVCHLNLHKTFCIPHGGGGPGMGPIGVMPHLLPFLPGHCVVDMGETPKGGAVSAAPWGSASILVISWMYIAMMGAFGLKKATEVAILNANYMARRLQGVYPILYKGNNGTVAHECILDLRSLKKSANIDVDDIAKRLMDYGFHAPTISWPVAGTMMVEPTESESLDELDRFCASMIAIRQEIAAIESGEFDRENNPLKQAPHTAESLILGEWNRPYSREVAAYPAAWTRDYKYWPPVGRIDNAFGDRNFVCSCAPMTAYQD